MVRPVGKAQVGDEHQPGGDQIRAADDGLNQVPARRGAIGAAEQVVGHGEQAHEPVKGVHNPWRDLSVYGDMCEENGHAVDDRELYGEEAQRAQAQADLEPAEDNGGFEDSEGQEQDIEPPAAGEFRIDIQESAVDDEEGFKKDQPEAMAGGAA